MASRGITLLEDKIGKFMEQGYSTIHHDPERGAIMVHPTKVPVFVRLNGTWTRIN